MIDDNSEGIIGALMFHVPKQVSWTLGQGETETSGQDIASLMHAMKQKKAGKQLVFSVACIIEIN